MDSLPDSLNKSSNESLSDERSEVLEDGTVSDDGYDIPELPNFDATSSLDYE